MATSQQILNDVDLRYRNTFTTDQKLVWFNEEQRELFDILELDSPPYAFVTVEDENFYPFPDQFDVTKIKVVSLQIDDTPNFIEIPNKRNDDRQYAPYGYPWWAVVSDAFYLSYQMTVPGDRTIYIYCDSDPEDVTTGNLDVSPSLPVRFQELLKLGILKRIAGARKDGMMYSNYDAEHEQKISDILWQKKLAEPEWTSPIDVMPRIGRGWRRGAVAILTEISGST